MRGHVTGLLLALLLLAVAVPATLGCCLGTPPGGGAHPWPPKDGYAAAAVVAVQAAAQPADGDSFVRDCAEHPAPAQTPYIETSNGGGGRGTVTSRGFNAGIYASAASLPVGAVPAHRYGVAADDTGPPLWLRTCVSRT